MSVSIQSTFLGLGRLTSSLALGLACLAAFGVSPALAQRSPADIASDPQHARNGRHEALRIAIGEQRVLSAEGVRSFSEGIKNVIDIRLTKDNERFVIVGQRPGDTTVLFIMLDGDTVTYDVTVIDPNAGQPKQGPAGLEARDNIRLDFYFVQLSNSYSHNVGLSWPTSISANTTAVFGFDLNTGASNGATATISSTVLPRLDLAQADGWAKVMRKAAVITANKTQASFSGGAEFNAAIQGGFGGSVRSVNFGSEIRVRPNYDKTSGRINLEIDAQVSDIAPELGSGVPGRTISSLQTDVSLELGQSLVLAGLSASSDASGRSGLPGLSKIPVLGLLFGNHTRRSEESETVIFIVPSVIDTVSLQRRALIGEALQAYEDYSGDLNKRPLMPETNKR